MPSSYAVALAAMAIQNRLLAIQWQATPERGDSNAGAGRRRVLLLDCAGLYRLVSAGG